MHEIKTSYKIIVVALLLIGIVLIPTIRKITNVNSEDVSLIIALLAICISIISIALVDKKRRYLKLIVSAWATQKVLGFHILNNEKYPLENIFISFRCQSKSLNTDLKSLNKGWKYHDYGDTTIIFIDSLKYLSTEKNNNFSKIEFPIDLEKWTDSRQFFLSITAKDRGTTTYMLNAQIRDDLKNIHNASADSKRKKLEKLRK